MTDRTRQFAAVCAVAIALLATGDALLLSLGGVPPAGLLKAEVLAASLAALLYGYGLWRPEPGRSLHPLRRRPIRGTALIVLGLAALWVPTQFLLSAWLIGVGLRLLWQAACDAGRPAGPGAGVIVITGRPGTGISPDRNGTAMPDHHHRPEITREAHLG
jgi:hypothetical protein